MKVVVVAGRADRVGTIRPGHPRNLPVVEIASPDDYAAPMDALPRFTLILPAAGSSTRFGTNKLLAPLAGEPVIARTLGAFLDHPSLAAVVIATSQPNTLRQACVRIIARAESMNIPVTFAPGGESRAHSVLNALKTAPVDVEWAAIHDAARPLISRGLIDRTLTAAVEHGAATPALPVSLTIKEASGALPSSVKRTLQRETLWAVQTPQVARLSQLVDAAERCPLSLSEITDDLQLLELSGLDTWLLPGDERNIKLTTPLDLTVAEAYLLHP